MKNNQDFPLTVSLHGMSKRLRKTIKAYLKLLPNHITVVPSEQAQFEIVDVNYSIRNEILHERLANSTRKPMIVISSHDIANDEFIVVKKPLKAAEFFYALLTVKEIIQSGQPKMEVKKITERGKLSTGSANKALKHSAHGKQPKVKAQTKITSDSTSAESRTTRQNNNIAEEAAQLLKQMAAVNKQLNIDSGDAGDHRKTIRYSFDGIAFSLKVVSLTARRIYLPIKLLDISSKGAMIQCDKQLRLHTKVVLKFHLSSQKSYNLTAKVVRKKDKNCYGLIFKRHYHKLIDFLISIADSYDIAC